MARVESERDGIHVIKAGTPFTRRTKGYQRLRYMLTYLDTSFTY